MKMFWKRLNHKKNWLLAQRKDHCLMCDVQVQGKRPLGP